MSKKVNNSMFTMTDAEYKDALKLLINYELNNLKKDKKQSMFTSNEIYEAFNKAVEKRNNKIYGKKSYIYCK